MNEISSQTVHKFVRKVIEYYSEEGQSYPWREEDANPYEILIAEVFLTRTVRKQAQDVFERFISRFPDISTLNRASREEIRDIIEPLGLHWRADNIYNLGRRIEEEFNNEIPRNEEIFKLPGIGSYHGNMILCLAFGKNTSPVDTNIARVLNRVFGLEKENAPGRLSRNKKIKKTAEECSPSDKCAEYNLGLLDLGNEICRPQNPVCEKCPLKSICYWSKNKPRL